MGSFTPASVIPRKGAQEADVRESERGADRTKKVESVVGTDRQLSNGSEPVQTQTVRFKTVRTVRF